MTRTHTVLARLATVGMVSTAVLMMAPQANGQTPRYRLTPLVKLGFTPQADLHGTLGINNKGQVVYGYVEPTSGDERAWLWLPETDADDGGALLWEDPEATTPGVTDLNDASAIGACNARWALAEAHDINDDGWIITWGVDTFGTTGTHAILLTPFPECPIDIDHDGCVDINDFRAVINNWGSCPVGSICHADTDGNCAVDVDDLLNVNNATWGCPACGASFGGGDSPPSLEEAIAIVLDANIPEATKAEIISELVNNWN